jgi:hypothetical protein
LALRLHEVRDVLVEVPEELLLVTGVRLRLVALHDLATEITQDLRGELRLDGALRSSSYAMTFHDASLSASAI